MRWNMFVNIFILENFSVDVRVAFFTVVSSVISFPAFKLLGKTIFFSTIALDLAHRNCSLTSLTNSIIASVGDRLQAHKPGSVRPVRRLTMLQLPLFTTITCIRPEGMYFTCWDKLMKRVPLLTGCGGKLFLERQNLKHNFSELRLWPLFARAKRSNIY